MTKLRNFSNIKYYLGTSKIILNLLGLIYIICVLFLLLSALSSFNLIHLSSETQEILEAINYTQDACDNNNIKISDSKEEIKNIFIKFLNLFNHENKYYGNFQFGKELNTWVITQSIEHPVVIDKSVPNYHDEITIIIRYAKQLETHYSICDILREYDDIYKEILPVLN